MFPGQVLNPWTQHHHNPCELPLSLVHLLAETTNLCKTGSKKLDPPLWSCFLTFPLPLMCLPIQDYNIFLYVFGKEVMFHLETSKPSVRK